MRREMLVLVRERDLHSKFTFQSGFCVIFIVSNYEKDAEKTAHYLCC